MPYTDSDCVGALQEATRILGETPSKQQYEALDISPSATSIRRIMGGWNEAKDAAGLELLTYGDRNEQSVNPPPEGIALPDELDWYSITPQQRWYYANREHRIEVKNKRRKKLIRWLFEYKRDHCQCKCCGEGYPGCLDFHHISDKEGQLSQMANAGYGKRSLLTEIDNCDVLCANCHQKEHHPIGDDVIQSYSPNESDQTNQAMLFSANRQRRAELRQWLFDFKAKSRGCVRCGEKDPRCLEFHHLESAEKSQTVGQMIVFQPSVQELQKEIETCEILCRNCHRKEHYDPPEIVG